MVRYLSKNTVAESVRAHLLKKKKAQQQIGFVSILLLNIEKISNFFLLTVAF